MTFSEGAVSTLFILMARSGPRAVIPLDRVCRDHFTPLLPVTFVRKV
ncbi:pyocin activator PrtN family protein [Methylobacterium fujisawaense]